MALRCGLPTVYRSDLVLKRTPRWKPFLAASGSPRATSTVAVLLCASVLLWHLGLSASTWARGCAALQHVKQVTAQKV